jgi:hypothetical protein
LPNLVGRCAHAVGIPGCRYEVGLIGRGDHYELVWDDWYQGGLVRALGTNMAFLWQAYVREVVDRVTAERRHIVSRFRDQSAALRLRVLSGRPGQVAYLLIAADATAKFCDLDGSFRYLIDALGVAHLEEPLSPTDQ